MTRAFFAQRDFTSTDILVEFYSSLQTSMEGMGHISESTLHMGTILREMIHKFRYKTLVLVKLLLLGKKVSPPLPPERRCGGLTGHSRR